MLYRIAQEKHIKDLTVEGSRIAGGRWNKEGVAVIYTSESVSLATVEYLVHLPSFLGSSSLMLAKIPLPDSLIPEEIDISISPLAGSSYPHAMLLRV